MLDCKCDDKGPGAFVIERPNGEFFTLDKGAVKCFDTFKAKVLDPKGLNIKSEKANCSKCLKVKD